MVSVQYISSNLLSIMGIYSSLGNLEVRAVNQSAYVDDNNFGPFFAIPGKATFDFTLLFEETILSIAPSALLLLLIPPRIIYLWKSPRKVISSYLLTAKIVSSPVYSKMIEYCTC